MIKNAATDIDAIYKDLKPLFPLFKIVQSLPAAGPYLGQIVPLISYADGLAQAGNEIALALGPLLEESPTGQTALSLPERVSQVLDSGQAHFVTAEQAVEQASQMRSRIRPELPACGPSTVPEA